MGAHTPLAVCLIMNRREQNGRKPLCTEILNLWCLWIDTAEHAVVFRVHRELASITVVGWIGTVWRIFILLTRNLGKEGFDQRWAFWCFWVTFLWMAQWRQMKCVSGSGSESHAVCVQRELLPTAVCGALHDLFMRKLPPAWSDQYSAWEAHLPEHSLTHSQYVYMHFLKFWAEGIIWLMTFEVNALWLIGLLSLW